MIFHVTTSYANCCIKTGARLIFSIQKRTTKHFTLNESTHRKTKKKERTQVPGKERDIAPRRSLKVAFSLDKICSREKS